MSAKKSDLLNDLLRSLAGHFGRDEVAVAARTLFDTSTGSETPTESGTPRATRSKTKPPAIPASASTEMSTPPAPALDLFSDDEDEPIISSRGWRYTQSRLPRVKVSGSLDAGESATKQIKGSGQVKKLVAKPTPKDSAGAGEDIPKGKGKKRSLSSMLGDIAQAKPGKSNIKDEIGEIFQNLDQASASAQKETPSKKRRQR